MTSSFGIVQGEDFFISSGESEKGNVPSEVKRMYKSTKVYSGGHLHSCFTGGSSADRCYWVHCVYIYKPYLFSSPRNGDRIRSDRPRDNRPENKISARSHGAKKMNPVNTPWRNRISSFERESLGSHFSPKKKKENVRRGVRRRIFASRARNIDTARVIIFRENRDVIAHGFKNKVNKE